MSDTRASVVGMLVIKRDLIDVHGGQDRLVRWTAQAVEVLLECELSRIDAARPQSPQERADG